MRRILVATFCALIFIMMIGLSGCATSSQQKQIIENQKNIIKNQELALHHSFLSEHPAIHPQMGPEFIELLLTAKAEDYESLSLDNQMKIGMLIFRLEEAYNMRHIWDAESWSLLEKDAKMVWRTPLVKEHWKRGNKNWHSKKFQAYVEWLIAEGEKTAK